MASDDLMPPNKVTNKLFVHIIQKILFNGLIMNEEDVIVLFGERLRDNSIVINSTNQK